MKYLEFLNRLQGLSESKFADFQRHLIFTDRKILGVRTPTMRKIAKECVDEIDDLLSFPNEHYETVFIKLTAVALLPYDEFLKRIEECVSWIDNWALCDSFKAKCIKKHKEEFLPVLEGLFATKKEFFQRYVLVVLLTEYVEERYFPVLETYIFAAETEPYYVYMAVAWLIAEILIKHYNFGLELLKKGKLPPKTHNKAIQKAIESYRLTTQQKEYLKSLKTGSVT